ncbi:MAG: BON domain-containing protein [Alphaproteobacteria bacterium]|nr:BON domain-containing protein [Alphaproteobacteria bacterium]
MKHFLLVPLVATIALGACSPISILGGAATLAGMAAVREGGISQSVEDARIQTFINDLWFRYDVETFRKLDLTVNQGRVLITGVVQDPEDRVEAVRLAWQVDGVQQVINEIRIAEGEGIQGFVRDNWISARLRTALTLDKLVQNLNYSIDTVQGTVYLMGVAQSQAELNRVLELARTTPHVRQVVSYIKLAGEPVTPAGG